MTSYSSTEHPPREWRHPWSRCFP